MNIRLYFLFSSIILVSSTIDSFNIKYTGKDAYYSYETSWGKERFVKQDYILYYPFYEPYVEQIHFVDVAQLDMKKLSYPYSALRQIHNFNNFGMYFNSKYIAKLFEHNSINNAIEIGSYYGLSTRHIASLLPDGGKLYAIDSWLYHEGMYEQFLSNIVLSGLTSKVIPIKQQSSDAITLMKLYAPSYDLIYVDGDHETVGVLSDLELYYPLLSKHGVICGDDWLLATVRAAVVEFAQKYDLTIYAGCNFWFLKNEGNHEVKIFLDYSDDIWKM